MKHQRSDFNALPALFILRSRDVERRMWNPPCASIEFRIEALDQNDLIRRQAILVVPPTYTTLVSSYRMLHNENEIGVISTLTDEPDRT